MSVAFNLVTEALNLLETDFNTTDLKLEEEIKFETIECIDFGIGHPSHKLNLDPLLLLNAMKELISNKNSIEFKESIDYGLCEGSWSVRCNLAKWLNNTIYGKHVDDGSTLEIELSFIFY